VITGRNANVLEGIASRVREHASSDTKVLAKTADITDNAPVTALFEATKEAVGKIDVLINSAGTLQAGLMGETDPTKFSIDLQVNVFETYLMTHHFLAQANGAGTVVTFTTGAIANVFFGMGGYTASKLAITRIMENLYAEQPNI
jgi:NAD(P)-dependent dehydrogenase (short-subunit alcohol dehydrogenase family)